MFGCSQEEAESKAAQQFQDGQSADAEQDAQALLESQWQAKQRLLQQKYPKMVWSPADKESAKEKFFKRSEEEKAESLV
jgi:hypothetical protein